MSRIAIVVQRYGEEVAGGAELHARYVALLLAEEHEVTVLTTTAKDYLTWAPHYPAGPSRDGDVAILRFDVERERDDLRFAEAARAAYAPGSSADDERRYLEEQGPYAPRLWATLAADRDRYDAVVAFSYRYITTQMAVRTAPAKSLLVPTAEDDPAVSLESSRETFRGAAALAYNSPEERDLIASSAGNDAVPGEVVGIFSHIPSSPDATRFRKRFAITGPYLLYVGRIDRNKGCDVMFEEVTAWLAETALPHELVLIGAPVLTIPDHPRIRHLGFVADADKFDAIRGADVLLMPSRYESLSMVTLEAMALGTPVLANGDCAVLRGQILRSNAGLYQRSYDEMFEALTLLVGHPRLRRALGDNGRKFYVENYSREVIAGKYRRLLAGILGTKSATA